MKHKNIFSITFIILILIMIIWNFVFLMSNCSNLQYNDSEFRTGAINEEQGTICKFFAGSQENDTVFEKVYFALNKL